MQNVATTSIAMCFIMYSIAATFGYLTFYGKFSIDVWNLFKAIVYFLIAGCYLIMPLEMYWKRIHVDNTRVLGQLYRHTDTLLYSNFA